MLKNKKENLKESILFLLVFNLIFYPIVKKMGFINMINTIINLSQYLLFNVCFYIMSLAVITGAIGKLFSEFKVLDLLNNLLTYIIKPLYKLPGASSLAIITCYLSDNPAILTLIKDNNFLKFFKKYELPALTNLATSFGMGLIITATVIGMDVDNSIISAIIGNIGAIFGSIISVRIMLYYTKKYYKSHSYDPVISENLLNKNNTDLINEKSNNIFQRIINSLLDGGKSGVELGLSIIPGVLIICSFVMILTNSPNPNGLYTGAYNEGIYLLPIIGEKLDFIIKPLFGFTSSEAISVPITALGSAGAAIGLIPELIKKNLVNSNDLAVFTAMSMCWSGYLSTHVAMMDSIGTRNLTKYAIFSHTIGGIAAGFFANLLSKIVL